MSKKEDRHIYSVTELTRNIKVIIEQSFKGLWVEGEISNLKLYPSGHTYFDLKDKEAVLKCVLWRWTAQYMKFKLEDGQNIVCFGNISLYEERGQYQLYVEKVEPKGVGALALAFEQLKKRLSKEGLFDEAHKKPIPLLPKSIGVVTSPTGAVIRDILNVLGRRFGNIEVIINPVRVQGKHSAAEIASAIEDFNKFGKIDVMIIARGGGSIEDLWAFNEEVVARAIYASSIPVISAIGHETDFTISDFVSDLRAPTPSAAAELVVSKKQELLDIIDTYSTRMSVSLLHKIKDLSALLKSYVLENPINKLRQYAQRVDELTKNITMNLSYILKLKEHAFKAMLSKLDTLSPLSILSRGYSITTTHPEGAIVKNVGRLKKSQRIKTRLSQGSIVSVIEDVYNK